MNSNEVDGTFPYKAYLKTNKNSLNQMTVRNFVNSFNLKIPALKIYSFKSSTPPPPVNPGERKSLFKADKFTSVKSAKIESQTGSNLDAKQESHTAKIDMQNTNSIATTDSSYNKPLSGGLPEIKSGNRPAKSLVIRNYKGIQDKIAQPMKKTVGQYSKTELKPKRKIEKEHITSETERKVVDLDTLKGIMLEGKDIIQGLGFSESTIMLEPEIELAEDNKELIEFIDHTFFKK